MRRFLRRASRPWLMPLAALAIALPSCSSSEETPPPGGTTRAVAIEATPAQQAAALQWAVKPGQRFEVHSMTHVEYVGANETVLFSEMVDRTMDAEVRESKRGLELEIHGANSEDIKFAFIPLAGRVTLW